MPSRVGDARETWSWHGTLRAAEERTFLMNRRRALSPGYAAAEVLWYLSGTADTTMLRAYSTKYDQMTGADENGSIAYGAYGPRFAACVSEVVEELLVDATRRAVAGLWWPGDIVAARTGCKDVPCTLSWQFIVRGGALHMTCTMRSNDVWMGFPYDVFANCCIQRLVANTLGVAVGHYHHQVCSLHVYERHVKAAMEALHWQHSIGDYLPHGWSASQEDKLDRCGDAVAFERMMRTGEVNGPWRPLPPMLRDLVSCCSRHIGEAAVLLSPALSKGFENYAHHRGSRPSRQDDVRQEAGRGDAGSPAPVPPPE